MAGATPEEAVDDFVGRIRSTLSCCVSGTAFGSGYAVGIEHSVTLYTAGQSLPNVARLSTHHGEGELLFRFAHLYTVVRVAGASRDDQFSITTSFYQYRILNRLDGEIVVYDWAPMGISPVRTPHMHIPAAGSVILPQRAGSRLVAQKTYLDDIHFPTGGIDIEDIAELLIREFRVDARRDDWHDVLTRNRKTIASEMGESE